MANGFTVVDSGNSFATGVTSDTTDSVTPALGDIVFVGAVEATTHTNDTLTGGGMTWTRRQTAATSGGNQAIASAWEATAGTPSAGALTYSNDDTFSDFHWALVRPSDLTYAAGNNNSSGSAASLTVTVAGNNDALLSWGYTGAVTTFTKDPDASWTEELDSNAGTGGSRQVQSRGSDDAEVVIDLDTTDEIVGICLEFASAGSPSAPAIYEFAVG